MPERILPVAGQGYLVSADHGLLVDLDGGGKERDRWCFPAAIAGIAQVPAPTLVLTDGRVVRRAS